MSVDVNRCDRILLPFSNISVSPILVSIAIWQIYVRMGNAIWGALGTTVFFLLLNIGQDRIRILASLSWDAFGIRVIRTQWKGKIIGTYRAIIAKKTGTDIRNSRNYFTRSRDRLKRSRMVLCSYGFMGYSWTLFFENHNDIQLHLIFDKR